MVSIRKVFAPLVSLAAFVSAQDTNNPLAFVHPGWGEQLNANSDFTITWASSSDIQSVNLILRAGDSQNLTTLYTIASGIEDSGSYQWSIPADQATNTDYSILIQDAQNTDTVNYSPYFTILAVGQGITSSGASSQSATSSGSASASSSGSASASASESSPESSSESASASGSGSSSAASTEASSSRASGSVTTSSEAATRNSTSSATAGSSAASSRASASTSGSSASSSASKANAAVAVSGSLLAFFAGAAAFLA